jgi:integrase/recombinase XerD
MNNEPISPLRQRMLDAMAAQFQRQNPSRLYPSRQRLFGLSWPLARHRGCRRSAPFQLHQRQNGVQASSMNSAVSALRFFFALH